MRPLKVGPYLGKQPQDFESTPAAEMAICSPKIPRVATFKQPLGSCQLVITGCINIYKAHKTHTHTHTPAQAVGSSY